MDSTDPQLPFGIGEVKIDKQLGVVVLLDALGTKGIWQSRDPSKVIAIWQLILGGLKFTIEQSKNVKLDVEAFSDTVIISGMGSDFYTLLNETGRTVNSLICMSMLLGINFRGCLSIGDFYKYGNTIIGPAIDEAAQYHNLAEWIGVSAAPSAHSIIDGHNPVILHRFGESNIFMKYDIPIKNGIERNGWALNWPLLNEDIPNYMNELNENKYHKTLRELVKSRMKETSNVSVSLKWRNTFDFLNESIKETALMDELFKKDYTKK